MRTAQKTDVEIQRDVLDELTWDPVVEVTDVGVEVDRGVVTLTGNVATYAIKEAAARATLRVAGVRAVASEIVVIPPAVHLHNDTEIARAAANAVELAAAIPADWLDIKVESGLVTLRGSVDWNYQRVAAERAVRPIVGVIGVNNLLAIRPQTVSAEAINSGIEQALVRSAAIDASHIAVQVDGGHVRLSGSVRSQAERAEAEVVAWRAQGVTRVTNDVDVQIP